MFKSLKINAVFMSKWVRNFSRGGKSSKNKTNANSLTKIEMQKMYIGGIDNILEKVEGTVK